MRVTRVCRCMCYKAAVGGWVSGELQWCLCGIRYTCVCYKGCVCVCVNKGEGCDTRGV